MREHQTPDPLEAMLVRAARNQRAPREARARIRAAVGLAAGVSTLATASAAAAASGKQAVGTLTALGIAKYAVVGAACGALAIGVTRLASPPASVEPPAAPPPVASSAPARVARVPSPVPVASVSEPEPEQSAAPSAMVTAAPVSSSPPVPTLAGELETLDAARSALRRRDAASALVVLDTYAHEYPRGQMSAEALVLRIQALVQAGNRSAAESLARSFEQANPNSPLVERVRAIVGNQNP